MSQIIGMSKEVLLDFVVKNPLMDRLLSDEEVFYIAKALGAYWGYDYEAAKHGKVGLHALLKSGLHSDGFFISAILLENPFVRLLFANQLVMKLNEIGVPLPDWIIGVPKGATKLGNDVAKILNRRSAVIKKDEEGRIVLESDMGYETGLGIEDFTTRGTGFTEAVLSIRAKSPNAKLLPYEGVILNRGGLSEIRVAGMDRPFKIVAVADHRVADWTAEECPLCKMGSEPIKPKSPLSNWDILINSQL
jgi:orotate phosphoribosyltransferase